uniref:F-box protein 46 n=1 Tax=Chrysemys picta bellii TaxID=8478 RepID=A0A8C3H786_CHRPI
TTCLTDAPTGCAAGARTRTRPAAGWGCTITTGCCGRTGGEVGRTGAGAGAHEVLCLQPFPKEIDSPTCKIIQDRGQIASSPCYYSRQPRPPALGRGSLLSADPCVQPLSSAAPTCLVSTGTSSVDSPEISFSSPRCWSSAPLRPALPCCQRARGSDRREHVIGARLCCLKL